MSELLDELQRLVLPLEIATLLAITSEETLTEAGKLVVRRLAFQFDAMKEKLRKHEESTYCAYCGFTVAMDADGEIIAQHIATCDKHPMSRTNSLNTLAAQVHVANKKWWIDLKTNEPKERNVGEMLMLITSELAEAMEGHRKNLPDDKLSHRFMFEVELADALIRLLDLAGGMKLDIGGAFREKMAYNATRTDHTVAARLAPGGKVY